MSLPKKHGNKVNVDYKARLEHKLYLARENPEPLFDVSECSLKQVPSGIYSLCRVFRKKALWMHCNKLSSLSGGGALNDLSLLTILDLHENEFSSLPPDIMCLVSLKELYLQGNNIRKLPNELVHLSKLTVMNVSKNNLKQLPEAMGKLKCLTCLDIGHNRSLRKLPRSLGHAQHLTHLNIDGLNLIYPPCDILDGGVIVIIAFLANESGIRYSPEDSVSGAELPADISSEGMQTAYYNRNNDVQATLQKLEKKKEHRQHAWLEVEKNMKQQQEHEIEVQSVLKAHRKKLLEDLAVQQTQLEHELERVQQERDSNRARLLDYVTNAEKEADNVINEFLRNSEEERQAQAELVEREKEEEMRLLSACHSEQFMFRTKDTLLAMEKLLEEELYRTRKLEEHTKYRDYAAQSLLTIEVRNHDHLSQIVQDQERNRQDLIDRLRQDEVLQKAAVVALLERSDARSWSIVQQVNLVQTQLAALTNIELERKKLEMNQQLNEIAEKRVALSAILLSLLDQQNERRSQLLETISHIEQQRNSRRGSQFWLMQYQSLMDARPQGLLEMLEPTLVRHVAIAGALHCLPFLAALPSLLPNLNDDQLKDIGINSESDRAAIKLAVQNYLAESKLSEQSSVIIPSAPLEEASASSGSQERDYSMQDMNVSECVVCLDLECEVIFLPCGHLCCCFVCAGMVSAGCPMCRSVIDRKVRVVKS